MSTSNEIKKINDRIAHFERAIDQKYLTLNEAKKDPNIIDYLSEETVAVMVSNYRVEIKSLNAEKKVLQGRGFN